MASGTTRPRYREFHQRRESGSGTIWTLTLCALVWFGALTVVLVSSIRADRHHAAAAADLAALAAAEHATQSRERACETARGVAEANAARLSACAVTGHTVDVTVRVPARMWPGAVQARARAGPMHADQTGLD